MLRGTIGYSLRLMTSPEARARLGSTRRSECFWARTTEREAAAREERRGTLGTTGFDYSGPRRSHEGALEQQVSNTYTASIYRPTWARITRRAG